MPQLLENQTNTDVGVVYFGGARLVEISYSVSRCQYLMHLACPDGARSSDWRHRCRAGRRRFMVTMFCEDCLLMNDEALVSGHGASGERGWKVVLEIDESTVENMNLKLQPDKWPLTVQLSVMEIDDDESIVNQHIATMTSRQASELCAQKTMPDFIRQVYRGDVGMNVQAWMRGACGVVSLRDLDRSPEAAAKFRTIQQRHYRWLNGSTTRC